MAAVGTRLTRLRAYVAQSTGWPVEFWGDAGLGASREFEGEVYQCAGVWHAWCHGGSRAGILRWVAQRRNDGAGGDGELVGPVDMPRPYRGFTFEDVLRRMGGG